MKKTFTAPIILYPCVAPQNTIAASVNEIIAMEGVNDGSEGVGSGGGCSTLTNTCFNLLRRGMKTQNASGGQRNGNDKQNVSLRYLFNKPLPKVRGVF